MGCLPVVVVVGYCPSDGYSGLSSEAEPTMKITPDWSIGSARSNLTGGPSLSVSQLINRIMLVLIDCQWGLGPHVSD